MYKRKIKDCAKKVKRKGMSSSQLTFERRDHFGPCRTCRSLLYAKTFDGRYICDYGHIYEDFVDEVEDDAYDMAGQKSQRHLSHGAISQQRSEQTTSTVINANVARNDDSMEESNMDPETLIKLRELSGLIMRWSDIYGESKEEDQSANNGISSIHQQQKFWERILTLQSLLILQIDFLRDYILGEHTASSRQAIIDYIWKLWHFAVLGLKKNFESYCSQGAVFKPGVMKRNSPSEDTAWDEIFLDDYYLEEALEEEEEERNFDLDEEEEVEVEEEQEEEEQVNDKEEKEQNQSGAGLIDPLISPKVPTLIIFLALYSTGYPMLMRDLISLSRSGIFPQGYHLYQLIGRVHGRSLTYPVVMNVNYSTWFMPLHEIIRTIRKGQLTISKSNLDLTKWLMKDSLSANFPVSFTIVRILSHFLLPLSLYRVVIQLISRFDLRNRHFKLNMPQFPEFQITSLVLMLVSVIYEVAIDNDAKEQNGGNAHLKSLLGLEPDIKDWLQKLWSLYGLESTSNLKQVDVTKARGTFMGLEYHHLEKTLNHHRAELASDPDCQEQWEYLSQRVMTSFKRSIVREEAIENARRQGDRKDILEAWASAMGDQTQVNSEPRKNKGKDCYIPEDNNNDWNEDDFEALSFRLFHYTLSEGGSWRLHHPILRLLYHFAGDFLCIHPGTFSRLYSRFCSRMVRLARKGNNRNQDGNKD